MWNRFKQNWKEFWRIFRLEFKVNFGGHRLKMLKFFGVLVIPFLYGFIYIFAMWNPIPNTKVTDTAIIASKTMSKDDKVYQTLMNNIDHLNKTSKTISFKKRTINDKDLYAQNDKYFDELEKHNISLVIQPIYEKDASGNLIYKKDTSGNITTNLKVDNLTQYLGGLFAYALSNNQKVNGKPIMQPLIYFLLNQPTSEINTTQMIARALYAGSKNYTTPFKIYYNHKKNFVFGFGANNKLGGSETIVKLLKTVLDSSNDPTSSSASTTIPMLLDIKKAAVEKYREINNLKPGDPKFKSADKDVFSAMLKMTSLISSTTKPIDPRIIINQFEGKGKIEQYGFGLAPLFLSIGLWIGALSTTLMITPKLHERNTSKKKNFFAKLFLIWIANIMQVTILISALALIGFSELGTRLPFFYLTGFIIAMIFASMVFSIRCMVPTKITGIIFVTLFFVFQVTSAGGLFPVYTQNEFFKFLHPIMPFTYAVDAFRESLLDINYIDWTMNIFVLLLLSLPFIVIGPFIYSRRKIKQEMDDPKAFTNLEIEKQQEIAEIESALSDRIKDFFKKFKEQKQEEKIINNTKEKVTKLSINNKQKNIVDTSKINKNESISKNKEVK